MDKSEAELFTKLCGFCWDIRGVSPLIFDCQAEIYQPYIHFQALNHLESIGLIKFEHLTGFELQRRLMPENFAVYYYGRRLDIIGGTDASVNLPLGSVLFTVVGKELARICSSKPVDGYWEYVREQWKEFLLESTE